MAHELEIINPLETDNWDDLLLSNENSSIFHSVGWARVLHESYGYRPLYFAQINKNKFKTLIPIMEVNSFITGRRGVSLPFSDVCNPIVNKDIGFNKILEHITRYGKTPDGSISNLESGTRSYVTLKHQKHILLTF